MLLITVLRDPLQRIYSDLAYDGTWSCKIDGRKKTLEDYRNESWLIECAEKNSEKYTSELYTKVFSGSLNYAIPATKKLNRKGIDYDLTHMVDDTVFQIAKLVIAQFDILIILEEWKTTSIQLNCYGMHNNIEFKNVGRRKTKLPKLDHYKKLKQRLIEMNKYDIILYDYGKALAMNKTEICRKWKKVNLKKLFTQVTCRLC